MNDDAASMKIVMFSGDIFKDINTILSKIRV